MRYLGIDYGEKRVGVALGDDATGMAFPKAVIENNKDLLRYILELIAREHVEAVVLGESKNFKGEPNLIQTEISEFKKKLEREVSIPIHFEPEFLTSREATHVQGAVETLDASAAALILQSFFDKKRHAQ